MAAGDAGKAWQDAVARYSSRFPHPACGLREAPLPVRGDGTLVSQRADAETFKLLAMVRTDATVGTVDDWEWVGSTEAFPVWCQRFGWPRLANEAAALAAAQTVNRGGPTHWRRRALDDDRTRASARLDTGSARCHHSARLRRTQCRRPPGPAARLRAVEVNHTPFVCAPSPHRSFGPLGQPGVPPLPSQLASGAIDGRERRSPGSRLFVGTVRGRNCSVSLAQKRRDDRHQHAAGDG